MKIKQAIAQLCLKQDIMGAVKYSSEKHRRVQEAINSALPVLGGYTKPIVEILNALTDLELTTPIGTSHLLWSVAKDVSGSCFIVVGHAGGIAYAMMIPKNPQDGLPGAYTQLNSNHTQLTGRDRAEAIKRFLEHPCKDDDIVDWVSTKLGGQYVSKFVKDTLEAIELS